MNSSTASSFREAVSCPEKTEKGIPAFILFEQAGLCKTRSDARRLISQGGGYMNNEKIEVFDQVIELKNFIDGTLLLRAGKKRYMKISISRAGK